MFKIFLHIIFVCNIIDLILQIQYQSFQHLSLIYNQNHYHYPIYPKKYYPTTHSINILQISIIYILTIIFIIIINLNNQEKQPNSIPNNQNSIHRHKQHSMLQHPHHSPPLQTQYDPEHQYIPLNMFLTFPTSQDDYYIGQGSKFRRFLFQATAKQTYTSEQKKKYKQFLEYWEKNKAKLPANILNNPFWNQQWKMRWSTSQQFNHKNTIKAMQKYSDYILTNRFNVTPRAQKLLKQGIFYVCGRDAYLRPILVFDIDKMMTSNMTEQDVIETQKYFFQNVLNFYLLPGQVQTWVAIIDVNYRNLMSLISPLKSSIGFLSDTFRNRMRIAYIVRIPGSLSFIWRICKGFMQQETVQKINFLDDQQVQPLLKYTNPSQLQKKYGGTQPQITQFWPPRNVQRLQNLNLLNFEHPDIIRTPITPQAYKVKYQKGKLQGHTISKLLLKEQNRANQQISLMQENKITQNVNLNNSNGNKEIKTQNNTQIPYALSESKNNLIKNKIVPENLKNITWPVQPKPLSAPKFSKEDFVQWSKILA